MYKFSKKKATVEDRQDIDSDVKSNKKSKRGDENQKQLYECSSNCILLDESEISQIVDLLEEATKCPDENAQDWIRVFVSRHVECSNYGAYDTEERIQLDPNRLYLFPCSARNHPVGCYSAGDGRCKSTEVTIRKAMVHYENMRKLHKILNEAVKVHRLLADLDAAVEVADLEYISKLLRIKLCKPPSKCIFSSKFQVNV